MKHFFNNSKKEDKQITTPVTSNAATPITSPTGSIIDVDAAINPTNSRYHNDPMRTSKRPDTVGNFFDPMGTHGAYSVSKDVTNTGA